MSGFWNSVSLICGYSMSLKSWSRLLKKFELSPCFYRIALTLSGSNEESNNFLLIYF